MEHNQHIKRNNKIWWLAIGLSVLASLLYYSWPLGYWLNPAIGRQGLASDLAATGQPYNWLFSLLDVMSGVTVLILTLLLSHSWRQFKNLWIRCILWGYGLFGVFTAIDALLPMNCLVDQRRCGALIDNPIIILHGLASFLSILGFTISIAGVWYLLVITRKGASHLRLVLHLIVLAWFFFGVLTVALLITSRSSSAAQHVFITICSTWTILLPYILSRLHAEEQELALAIKENSL